MEDSYVLAILETDSELKFDLDAVLTQKSPDYHAPLPGEQYCYQRGVLVFSAVQSRKWDSRSTQTFHDATGDEDLGNIDTFVFDGGVYKLEGDWGEVELYSDKAPTFIPQASI
ncbi:hypothetical protein [Nocardia mangyaensis]|uniref:hypothetical protein n=1 Tax=Nocardia mangyaensis TaxID=2213200 RepID=UPI001F0B53C8|nr:hypothetical protein [Nocardia mangyaensis]